MSPPKVVLAYSGGLDTSVAIPWLKEHKGLDVVAVTVDVGQPVDLERVSAKARASGAVSAHVADARREFAEEFVAPALKANALYEGVYPLSTALARPLIGRHMVEVARREGARAVAHGCTGKGNDQVRFDLSTTSLAPELEVIAPAREWGMTPGGGNPLCPGASHPGRGDHGVPLQHGREPLGSLGRMRGPGRPRRRAARGGVRLDLLTVRGPRRPDVREVRLREGTSGRDGRGDPPLPRARSPDSTGSPERTAWGGSTTSNPGSWGSSRGRSTSARRPSS